jgi:hypothetical protein
MARELLIESRRTNEKEPLETVYATGLNVAAGEVVERWAKGVPAPGDDAHILNVHLHTKDGKHIGFRFYLVTEEPAVHLGPAPVEVEN